ncbi:fumarylacetoacetate hydrolase [Subtercola boreus]|uniref:Fumarylacetoacetate hydrolase n=1 Tax=Subtercola boreus TaxID=120213 RepID=A0A3E0W261_9MICO|nr:fumarylacetoacetate hydrolase family protein [Subtercola boreus]RFA16246.1 fumarylacetoacetate hydrolase [Subtercola boreus]
MTTPAPSWIGDSALLEPDDGYAGTLVGRVWNPTVNGPSPVVFTAEGVYDISAAFPTVSGLAEHPEPARAAREALATATFVGSFADIVGNTPRESRDAARPWLLAPVDLQAIKAAGVTFAVSMIERVIEERVKGDPVAAGELRASILNEIGADLRTLKPGSPEALALKDFLLGEGLWSQYLEVGIGVDAEIFTKGLALSAVGAATQVGVLSTSVWNNPEPEVVLIVSSAGTIVGATLGNDVNLRDIEGRSALLLPKAKDNNASCGLGPFVRLFDETFDLDAVRGLTVTLDVDGLDGFHLGGSSHMSEISRDPEDLVGQLMGPQHQYPDGTVLMLGTMFAPVDDRDVPGQGFTHKVGDIVRISSGPLGSLVNQVETSERCEPWQFGVASLMKNLAGRGLL